MKHKQILFLIGVLFTSGNVFLSDALGCNSGLHYDWSQFQLADPRAGTSETKPWYSSPNLACNAADVQAMLDILYVPGRNPDIVSKLESIPVYEGGFCYFYRRHTITYIGLAPFTKVGISQFSDEPRCVANVPPPSPPLPVIILDPGHGLLLGDDGKKHYQRPESPTFHLREDNLTLAIANAAKQQLESNGYEVVMTRTGPDAPYEKSCGAPDPVTDRIDKCNDDLRIRVAKAKAIKEMERVGKKRTIVYVSIHTNGGFARRYKGRTQTFYCFVAASPLASWLLDEIKIIAPPILSLFSGGYQGCDLAVISKTADMRIPGSLIEVLYHNNLDDETLLSNSLFLTQAGGSITKAIKDFTKQ